MAGCSATSARSAARLCAFALAVAGERARLDVVLPAPGGVAGVADEEHRAAAACARGRRCCRGCGPGTESAQSEPSPKTSTTPSKRPSGVRAERHSLSGPFPSSARVDRCRWVTRLRTRASRGLARAGVDGRAARHVAHARDVVEVQVGEEHARERRWLLREPVAERLVDDHALEVHPPRDQPAAARTCSGASRSARSTPVSTRKVPRVGWRSDVEEDLDRLGRVLEPGRLRARVLEVDEARCGRPPSRRRRPSRPRAGRAGRSRASRSARGAGGRAREGCVGWMLAGAAEEQGEGDGEEGRGGLHGGLLRGYEAQTSHARGDGNWPNLACEPFEYGYRLGRRRSCSWRSPRRGA